MISVGLLGRRPMRPAIEDIIRMLMGTPMATAVKMAMSPYCLK